MSNNDALDLVDLKKLVKGQRGDYRTQLQKIELRILLGLNPTKLPETGQGPKLLGDTYVWVLSRYHAKELKPGIERPHRVIAQCRHCQKPIPAGKLYQHIKIHKYLENK